MSVFDKSKTSTQFINYISNELKNGNKSILQEAFIYLFQKLGIDSKLKKSTQTYDVVETPSRILVISKSLKKLSEKDVHSNKKVFSNQSVYKMNYFAFFAFEGYKKKGLDEVSAYGRFGAFDKNFLIELYEKAFGFEPVIDLFDHNQYSYSLIKEFLFYEGHEKAAIVQPTGTGKMYIMAKIAYDIQRKGGKVLLFAPKKIIFEKFKDQFPFITNVKFATYQATPWLEIDDYDVILFDEFHRMSANVWSENLTTFLSYYGPEVKKIGFSATPIRADGRDSRSFFDHNTLYEMDLYEAIARGILPEPIYVTSLYTFKEEVEKIRQNIINSNMNAKKKGMALLDLKIAEADWANSYGIDKIFQKHLTVEYNRAMAFFKSVDHMEKVSLSVKEWFKRSGVFDSKLVQEYFVSSHTRYEKQNKQALREYETKDENELKIMNAIDMFSEGYHLAGLNILTFFRETKSHVIFLQQLGRIFSAGKTIKPIVFDFVNNLNNISKVDFEYGVRQAEAREMNILQNYNFKPRKKIPLEIYDYSVEIRAKLLEFRNKFTTFENWVILYEEWMKNHPGETTYRKIGETEEEQALIKWSSSMRSRFRKKQLSERKQKRILEIDPEFFFERDIGHENVLKYISWIDVNDREPLTSATDEVEAHLAHWKSRVRTGAANLSKKALEDLLIFNPDFFEKDNPFYRNFAIYKAWRKEHPDREPKQLSYRKDKPYTKEEEKEVRAARWRSYVHTGKATLAPKEVHILLDAFPDFMKTDVFAYHKDMLSRYKVWKANQNDPKKEPSKTSGEEEEVALANWRYEMKRKKKDSPSRMEFEPKILAISPDFFVNHNLNDLRIEQYEIFKKAHPDEEPKATSTIKEVVSLTHWLYSVRTGRNKSITDEQIQKLKTISPSLVIQEKRKA